MELFYPIQENKRLKIFLYSTKITYLSYVVNICVCCAPPTNMEILNASQDICSEYDKSPVKPKFQTVLTTQKDINTSINYQDMNSIFLSIQESKRNKQKSQTPIFM